MANVGVVLKVAVTALAADMVSMQVPVPVQPPVPDQPAKTMPIAVDGVRVTTVLELKVTVQFTLQFATEPVGENVTVPRPVPAAV